MEFYKGYIKTKDKKAAQKFKGGEGLLSLEEVRELPEYAGVLADDAVLIDVDDADQAEMLMHAVEALQLDCRVLQTRRGRHFLFKNGGDFEKCGTHKHLACGIVADVKIGNRNSYEVLKADGAERFVEWDIEDGGEYQAAPRWLLPVKSSADFASMEPGEGRNQALYNHILALTSAGLSKEESRECIKIINDFVLPEPLGEDEIETITRDEAFPQDVFYDGKRFCHEKFAQFLISNEKIRRINGQLHMYREGTYVPGYRHIEGAMQRHIPTLKAAHRTEVLKLLEIMCPDNTECADANIIAFANGIFDLSTGELRPHNPFDVVTNKIPWDFDPGAYSELADKTLDKLACGDEDIRALLEECIGYSFYRRNELAKAFLLTGDKSNGKSTFLNMVQNVLGEDNYSALDLDELGERFSVATTSGMLANVGDDISDEFLQGKTVSIFKKIVAGNKVKGENKGQDPFFFKPYVKMLFSANDIPRIRDKTGAVIRRLVIVPFRARFSKDDPDWNPYITYELQAPEVMRYLVRLGVQGLRRVLENNGFTESEQVTREVAEYEVTNNPVLLFLQDLEERDVLHQPTRAVHRRYDVFCAENGFTGVSLISFVKAVTKRLGYTTRRVRIDGKLESVFERGDYEVL